MPTTPQSALLIVDNQRAFAHPTHWGPSRSNPQYETNVTRLLAAARHAQLLIIHVQHLSLDPESALHPTAPAPGEPPAGGRLGVDLAANTTPLPEELVIAKEVNSAFIGTNLEDELRSRAITSLYICGLTTDHCVSTTARMASNLHVCDRVKERIRGRVVLVGDATACWKKRSGRFDAETVHAVHVESLREFVDIASTEAVVRHLERPTTSLETS